MTTINILHVDDEPDIREVVEISLALDPGFVVRSCGSGAEALAVAAEWDPDIILLDVMMPSMDGPTTLARLRENPTTADIPVIFMTARAQTRELDRFRALGAVGVIPKPFDPMTLAGAVRNYLQPVTTSLDDLQAGFLKRVERDVAELNRCRLALNDAGEKPDVQLRVKHLAHGLAGAGGIFGFSDISVAAAILEDAAIARPTNAHLVEGIVSAIDQISSSVLAGSARAER